MPVPAGLTGLTGRKIGHGTPAAKTGPRRYFLISPESEPGGRTLRLTHVGD
jgi:hypothetical protein